MKNRVLQTAVLATLVLALSSEAAKAATFYVRLDGSNSNTGLTNDSSGAWRNIDYAADHVAPGDTVRVQAGTYVEVASPGVSGSFGNTVTLVADGAVVTCGMTIVSKNYIRVIGFTMDGSVGGCSLRGARLDISGTNTGLEFWHNTLDNADHGFLVHNQSDRCNSCIIVGGTISHINNNTHGITMTGDDVFVGYVAFDQIAYLGVVPSGHRSRFVNLNFANMISDGGSHPDFFYIQGLNPFGYSNNLIESIYGTGSPTSFHNKAMHVQNQTVVPWNDNVWRQNIIYNMGSGYYSVYSNSSGLITRWRFYNDTVVNMVQAQTDAQYSSAGSLSSQFGALSASLFNNIYVNGWTDAARLAGGVNGWSAGYGGSTITSNYNLLYDTRGSVTSWLPDANPRNNVNPSFVNSGTNFSLQSGSGARGGGGALTTASGAGTSSTTLTVAANSGSFFIGSNASNLPQYGGALVPGDFITVGATPVQVTSVSGDVLTLATAISWNDGDPVYFGSSAIVDIGAYPFKAGGYTLSASHSIAGGTATITPNDASLVRFVACYSDGVPYAVDNSSPYTCAVPAGRFSANVYPRYASKTLWVTVGEGPTVAPPSAPKNLKVIGH